MKIFRRPFLTLLMLAFGFSIYYISSQVRYNSVMCRTIASQQTSKEEGTESEDDTSTRQLHLMQGVGESQDQDLREKRLTECNCPSTKLPLPTIYVVTPTYHRQEQIPELVRLGQTLLHVLSLVWIVAEDAKQKTKQVTSVLERIGVPFQHLLSPMPTKYVNKKGAKPRGVANRNAGLAWIRKHATEGVVYFADDDNTYDITLFQEMRYTQIISMWPVGLITSYGVSSPILDNEGHVKGFYDGWTAGRKFPIDMAGFAVAVPYLKKHPNATMPFTPGYEEDGFLRSLNITLKNIEPRADNCTKILVWHTQTKKNSLSDIINVTKYKDSNLIKLKEQILEKTPEQVKEEAKKKKAGRKS